MKLWMLIVMLLSANSSDVQQLLTKAEIDWNNAYKRHDSATLTRMLSDDYVFVDADGYVLDKKTYIDTGAKVQIKSDQLSEIKVRVFGDSAVVTSLWKGTYTFEGKEVTETIRYMDTFINKNGTWVTVATQGTRVPKR